MSLAIIRGLQRRPLFLGQSLVALKSIKPYSSSVEKPNIPLPVDDKDKPKKFSKENVQNVRREVRGFVFTRYFDYVSNYDKILEKKFPNAMHVYKVFLVGVKEFFSDMKKYLKITRIANGSPDGLRSLTRKEMELYYQLPKDMMKIAPVLLISTLPFANYVVFPIAYMYPRLFLSSHFWSLDQRKDFQQIYLKIRISNNRKVLRYLQSKLELTKRGGPEDFQKWNYVLGLLGSGTNPSSDEILAVKHLFSEAPYSLSSLPASQLNSLCKLHGIHTLYLKRVRLSERAYLIHNMDLAIKREGGVHNMPIDALHHACFLRGLNSAEMSVEHIVEWLKLWVSISMQTTGDNISLLLHLPILITYNHPNNWQLLHN